MSQNKEKEGLQLTAFKGISVVYSSINPSADIGTGYGFWEYHYLKGKLSWLLSLNSDIVSFDTGCLVILCNSSFFWAQVPNTPIWKIAIPIII